MWQEICGLEFWAVKLRLDSNERRFIDDKIPTALATIWIHTLHLAELRLELAVMNRSVSLPRLLHPCRGSPSQRRVQSGQSVAIFTRVSWSPSTPRMMFNSQPTQVRFVTGCHTLVRRCTCNHFYVGIASVKKTRSAQSILFPSPKPMRWIYIKTLFALGLCPGISIYVNINPIIDRTICSRDLNWCVMRV